MHVMGVGGEGLLIFSRAHTHTHEVDRSFFFWSDHKDIF